MASMVIYLLIISDCQLFIFFLGAVGQTPLIKIKSLSQETGREILAKAEFMNPGGSVKDRYVHRYYDILYSSLLI